MSPKQPIITTVTFAVSKNNDSFPSGAIRADALIGDQKIEIAKASFNGQSITPQIMLAVPKKVHLNDLPAIFETLRSFENQVRTYVMRPWREE